MVTTLIPYWTAVESSDVLNMNPPSPTMHITGRSGFADLRAKRRWERVAEIELVSRVYVRLRVLHLVVSAGVVAELGDTPNYVSVVRDNVQNCLQDRVLRLLQSDVVVGYEVAGRADRFCGRTGGLRRRPR